MERLQAKAQSSLEYLLIVALTFAILVPATYLFYSYSKESTQEIVDAQVVKIGRNIIDTSETIFYSGTGSRTILDLNMPESVLSATIIQGRELVFNITTDIGVNEVVFFSNINLTTEGSNCASNACTIQNLANPGLRKLKIEAISKDSVKVVTI